MLSICAVLILIILGLFFIKKDTQKELTKFVKDNAMLIGIGLLLFLFYGRNMLEGFKGTSIENIDETLTAESIMKYVTRDNIISEANEVKKGTSSEDMDKKVISQSSGSKLKYAPFKDLDLNNDGFLSSEEYNNVYGTMNIQNNESMNKMNNETKNELMNKMNNETRGDVTDSTQTDPGPDAGYYARQRAAEAAARRREEAEGSFTMFGTSYSMPNFDDAGLFGRN